MKLGLDCHMEPDDPVFHTFWIGQGRAGDQDLPTTPSIQATKHLFSLGLA